MADTLVTRCTAAHCTHLCSRSGATLFTIDFYDALQKCSKFPYSYIVPQNITEEVLTRRLNELGVEVWRGDKYRVVGMKGIKGSEDTATVEFEGGETVEAKYIIGVDGAKSVVCLSIFTNLIFDHCLLIIILTLVRQQIRQISGISFNDPRPSKSSSQMIVADVHFAQPPPSLLPPRHKNEMCLIPSATGFMLFEPFPSEGSDPKGPPIRIATAIPPEMGTPPDHPDLEYWQAAWDKFGPYKKSKIEEIVTSARFRTHSAVVDRYFTRFPGDTDKNGAGVGKGAAVFLIGDAAHVHPPAGGQGMNLGIRDAIYLAPVLVSHIRSTTDDDASLLAYANLRRQRALVVIGLANGMLDSVLLVGDKIVKMLPDTMGIRRVGEEVQRGLLEWGLWGLGRLGWVRRKAGYSLSGLGHR